MANGMKRPGAGRFDYVRYDGKAQAHQVAFKRHVELLEAEIEERLVSPKKKELALEHLELVYMCIGKALRDDQVARNGSANLCEQRIDS